MPDHAPLIKLLHEIDGQLGLAIHRAEGNRMEWRSEAADLVPRIRSAIKDLSRTANEPPVVLEVTPHDPTSVGGCPDWLLDLVNAQAEDPNLWRMVDATLHEEYVQRALRSLHAAIESLADG